MNNFTRFLLALINLSLFTVSSTGTHQPFSYNQIQDLYLQSFENTEKPSLDPKKPIDFTQLISLSDYEMRNITFSLFNRTEKADSTHVHASLSSLVQDLNLFYFKSNEQSSRACHLFSKVNSTQTVLGEAVLAKKLANPLTDKAQLESRQAFIRLLVEDETLFKKLDNAIKTVADKQSDLFYFWQDIAPLEQEAIDTLFFKGPLGSLNKSSLAMELSTRIGNTIPLLWLSCDAIGNSALNLIFTKKSFNDGVLCNFKELPKGFYPPHYIQKYNDAFSGQRLATFNTQVENTFNQNPMHWQSMGHTLESFKDSQLKVAKYSVIFALSCLGAGPLMKLYYSYQSLQHQRSIQHKTNYIHKKLNSVASLVRAFDSCNNFLKNNATALHALNNIDIKKSQDFDTLLGLMRTKTFTGNESFFSLSGRVKVAYTLIKTVKDELAGLMKFIGEIDAYLSIAKLYKEHQNTHASYSFVTFIEQNTPYLSAHNFWNPMLDANTAIGNDITLGIDGKKRAAIVTGSNSGGKSTIMVTGLTSVLLLAQTFGIAPASSLVMTPIEVLTTSLKVQDNVISGESHFVAETRRAASLNNMLKKLTPNKYAFVAIDELFEGTTAAVGGQALHDFGRRLVDYSNVLFVIATQYQSEPTQLEQETNGVCTNYKIDVIKNEDGTITRPHRLQEGVSSVSVGNILLQEAFDQ